jgi:putative membrane protein insertion efficiency factor
VLKDVGMIWQWLKNAPRQTLLALVRMYRLLLSPWLGNSCRFEPTCSAYAMHALEQHGAALGTCLTVGRLLRCHPWCEGGHDPVPEHAAKLFTRFVPSSVASGVPPAASATTTSYPEKTSP